ncbi:class I SAM-dependent methyltransferase [Pseudomonas sp. GW456-12-1-14-TSB6]|uniref:class I SAM-dependent methyltransferase n=1 Tax=Pseudomonas sp. GW456-12-1-14-TSB6 TaxID=2751350 RepID=UPI000CD1F5EE|nr:class I SAM-dependent methyltransferase [Pseudomonas sp. GW456-12-1-14-TSB6]POA36575.1 class I SAM-dependent methyltransferase [Pseudomonas sp. GW456-12-1-14-TSB6]
MQNEDKEWLDYRARFAEVYDNSNYESPLQSFVMRASHKLTESPYNEKVKFERVLEVGAGTGEHLAFVQHDFDEYVLTDMDAKTLSVAAQKASARHEGRLTFSVQQGGSIDAEDNSYDRLIATHVLEHIYYPHLALKEWRRVLKPGGVLSILIPTDPGIAWRFGRALGPRRNAIAQNIAYDYVMAREHVNSCNNLVALMRHYFPNAKESWWPFKFASIDMNLFVAFHAVVEKPESQV